MSEHIDLVRSIYAPFERGDYSSAAWADPEIELVFTEGPQRRRAKGLAAAGEAWSDFLRSWEDWRVVVEEYRELDDERVLVLVRRGGRGKTSGLELDGIGTEGAQLLHIRDGKITRYVTWADGERAFADLGLKE